MFRHSVKEVLFLFIVLVLANCSSKKGLETSVADKLVGQYLDSRTTHKEVCYVVLKFNDEQKFLGYRKHCYTDCVRLPVFKRASFGAIETFARWWSGISLPYRQWDN